MEPWYRERELNQMIEFFNRAIIAGDSLNAGAMFGFLYDALETARIYAQNRENSYLWKRIVRYLSDEIDKIEEASKDYPIPIQQALIAKVILYRQRNSI